MPDLSVRLQIDFWDSVYGFKMSVIKDMALGEPLVDVVEARAVATDARPILALDVSTCTREVRSSLSPP